jgi:hypothetical protein
MSEIKYNEAQRNELKTNKYVRNVTGKHIVFTLECKNTALKLLNKYMSSKEIFEKL